jgi:NAD(P)-dependent dehydrogenase (short-subunit alcohol dehydrogenase family)
MADLSGRVAIVTAASGGVGRGIAEGLAEAGATVYVTGRAESFEEPPAEHSIQATTRRVDELGGHGIAVRVDHRADHELRALVDQVLDEQGRLDVLVSNGFAAPAPPRAGPFWKQPLSLWDEQCSVVLRGYYAAAVFAAPAMVARRSGLIVQVSPAASEDHGGATAQRVASAAVDRLVRGLAQELEAHGVAALSLWPGRVTSGPLPAGMAPQPAGAEELARSPRFVGRGVAALAMDPDVLKKSGGAYRVAELAREYRFTDPADTRSGR